MKSTNCRLTGLALLASTVAFGQNTQLQISQVATPPSVSAGTAYPAKGVDGAYHTSAFPSSCTVSSVSYKTAGDCAFYTAMAVATSTGLNQLLVVDNGETDTCAGWVHPVSPNNATVSIIGAASYAGSYDVNALQGFPVVHLKQTCAIGSNAVITYLAGTGVANSNGPVATIKGLYIDANNNAGACGDFLHLSRSAITDNVCVGVAGTSRHGFKFGDSGASGDTGWMYETEVKNLTVYTNSQTPLTGGSGRVTVSGGSAIGYTIIAHGGVGSFTAPMTSYSVVFTGWGVGVSQPNGPAPCATNPTAHVTSLAGGQFWGMTFDTPGSGCDPNNTFFEVIPTPVMDEAFWFDKYTDGTATNLVSVGGVNTAAVFVGGSSAGSTIRNVHAYGNDVVMVKLAGSSIDLDSPFCDAPLQACILNFGHSNWVHGGYRNHVDWLPGAGDFWDVAPGTYGNTYGPISGCSGAVAELGYNTFGSINGPLDFAEGFNPRGAALSIRDVQSCSPTTVNGGLPLPINAIPSPASIGSILEFSVNFSGPGQADCTAVGAGDLGGIPGYNATTGILTFPAGAYQNGGSLTCTLASGNMVTRIIPSTGTNPQTFSISTLLSALPSGTWSLYSNLRLSGNATASTITAGSGGNIIYRCTVAGALPVGALTTVTASCGASADTGVRTQ